MITSSTLGAITGTSGQPRILEFGLKYYFQAAPKRLRNGRLGASDVKRPTYAEA